MDKLDLVFLPFVYALQMTQPLFLLGGSQLCHFYNYWFHTCNNVALLRRYPCLVRFPCLSGS